MNKIYLNDSQEKIVNSAVYWFKNSSSQLFQYSGKAGTGKSVVLNEIINRLGLKDTEIMPMSYTGTAAIVMRKKGLTKARTIHSSLYEPYDAIQYDEDGKIVIDTYFNKPKKILRFKKKEELKGIKLILIDEASMTPMRMVGDIMSFGIKVIACGDLNQLPPVGDEPGFLMDGTVYFLDQIMRQSEESGIVFLANEVLEGKSIPFGTYGNVRVIASDDITNEEILDSDIVLSCKNTTRDTLNERIQKLSIGTNSKLPKHGEPLICRKNNWTIDEGGINLVNGLRGYVDNYPDITSVNSKTFTLDFRVDYTTCFNSVLCDYEYYKAPLIKRKFLKNNRFSEGNKFELAYAITTHLSQGSQYKKGIFIEEYLGRDIMKNLIYTGITRFSDSLIYIKSTPKYY